MFRISVADSIEHDRLALRNCSQRQPRWDKPGPQCQKMCPSEAESSPVNIRSLAAVALASVLTLSLSPTSTASDANPEPSAAPEDLASLAVVPDEPPIPDEYRERSVDTPSLYQSAGLTPSKHTRNELAEQGDATNKRAYTNPSGYLVPPGLKDHVDQYCGGTGTDGVRVQAMYVRETGMPDRYSSVTPVLLNELRYIDDVFAVSSMQTGGGRRVRWVTDGSCNINILNVVLPNGSISGDFNRMEAALRDAGYLKTQRKYLAFADVVNTVGGGTCGQGTVLADHKATDNLNDGRYAQLARVDSPCWVTSSEYNSISLHELLHTLGAAQPTSPNGTQGFHCTDLHEVMCYNDGWATPREVCPASNQFDIDCNNDDYFHTNPAAGSYLRDNWNVANSPALAVVPALPQPPTMSVTASTTSPSAGDTVTLQAAVAAGTTVKWTTNTPECENTNSASTGTTYTIRCFNRAVPEVTATASDSGITVRRIPTVITYGAGTEPSLQVTRPNSAAAGRAFALAARVENSSASWSYSWTIRTPGCSADSRNTPTINVTCDQSTAGATAAFTVAATRTGDGRVETTTFGVTIAAAGSPTASIEGPTTVLAGQPITLVAATDVAPANAIYKWTTLRGYPATANTAKSFRITPPSLTGSDTDTAFVEVTDTSTGKSIRVSHTYSVEAALSVAVSGPSLVQSGQVGTFTATANKSATYTWSLDQPDRCAFSGGSNSASVQVGCDSLFEGAVRLSVTAAKGTESVVQSRTVNVSPHSPEDTKINFTARGSSDVTFIIELTTFDGAPIYNADVVVETKTSSGWSEYFRINTGAHRVTAMTRALKRSASFRATYSGDNVKYYSTVSATRTIKIATRLSNVKTKTGLKATLQVWDGTRIKSAPIGLQSRKRGTTRWVNTNKFLTNSVGQVAYTVNPRKQTEYRWVYAATPGFGGSVSDGVILQ
jgi:hypothetical protein